MKNGGLVQFLSFKKFFRGTGHEAPILGVNWIDNLQRLHYEAMDSREIKSLVYIALCSYWFNFHFFP